MIASLLLQRSPFDGSAAWLLILMGALLLLYLAVMRPALRRRRDPLEKGPSSGAPSLSQQRSVERQMQNLLVELSDMARQISAQLDTRAAKLELLLKDADEKIDRLRSMTGGADGAPPVDSPEPDISQRTPVSST